MKKGFVLMILFSIFLSFSFISASNYLDFNQVGSKIVVKENISGIYSSYVDSKILEKTSGGYVFLKRINFNQTIENLTIKINLERGYSLDNQNVYPTSYELQTDGEAISLVWDINQLSKGDSFAIFVNIIQNNPVSIWLILIIGLFIILILAALGYFLFLRSKKSSKFEQHLLDSEKKVISELKKTDRNELWQKQLQLATGFSKAKMSRVIRNLESRDLIKKIPMGNTNKVVLK